MKVKSISFENYKAFSEKQTMQLRPITILIGKNSSGKSSIAKLFTLFETSLSGNIDEPLLLDNNGVELGGELDNLFFNNNSGGISLNFKIAFDNDVEIEIGLVKKRYGYGLEVFEWKYKDNTQRFDLKLRDNQYFEAISGKKYKCEFKGFIPSKFNEQNTIEKLSINNLKIEVDYIGPFRALPKRAFYLTGPTQYQHTGIAGENAYPMLVLSRLEQDNELYDNVQKWYENHFDGWKLEVKSTDNLYFQVMLSKNITRTKDDKDMVYENPFSINIVDVGQGMNQALPLVVRANVKNRPESIIVLEQPELHLHPAAHGDLAELFARSAKENDQTFIIETHSENILLRLRKLIIENDFGFTKDDLVIYWIEGAKSKGQELRQITVDEEGVLSDWPGGVFNENVKEIIAMRKTLSKRKKSQ